VVGTVADVTDVHVFKRWGEVWRFKSEMVGASFTACTLDLAPGNGLTGFGHEQSELKRGRAHLLIFMGA
jgi:hypothetical protein